MSRLRKVKWAYCIIIMFFAVALTCTGGLIEWIIAVVMLTGALPMFCMVSWAASDQGADEAITDLRRRWHEYQSERAIPGEENAASAHQHANRQ